MKELKFKTVHRVLSAALALMLLVGSMPSTVWASPDTEPLAPATEEAKEANAEETPEIQPAEGGEPEVSAAVKVTVNKTGKGSVTATVNGETADLSNLQKDADVLLKLTPDSGWKIAGVTVGDKSLKVEDNQVSFKAESDTQVDVKFTKDVKLTVTGNDDQGTFAIDGSEAKSKDFVLESETGVKAKVTVTAKEGYRIVRIRVNGEDKTFGESKYEETLTVTDDTTVKTEFEKTDVAAIRYDSQKGTIVDYSANCPIGSVSAKAGSEVEVKVAAKAGKRISRVIVYNEAHPEGQDLFKKSDDNENSDRNKTEYEFSMPSDKDFSVRVRFVAKLYYITAESGEHGKVSIDRNQIEHGDDSEVTVKLIPDSGYVVSSVSVNGEAVKLDSLSPDENFANNNLTLKLSKITEDKAVTVKFEKAEAMDFSQIQWNGSECIKFNSAKNQYVFAKDKQVTFNAKDYVAFEVTTDKETKKIHNFLGANNSYVITSDCTVKKIRIFYFGWREVKVDGKSVNLVIAFDKTKPEAVIDPNSPADCEKGYFNSSAELSVKVTDREISSDLSYVKYWIETGAGKTEATTLFTYDGEEVSVFEDSVTLSEAEYGNVENVVVYVEAADRAGNVVTAKQAVHINSKKPEIAVSVEGGKHEEGLANYYNGERTGTVTITDSDDCFNPSAVKVTAKINNASHDVVVTWKDKVGTFTLSEEGKYTDFTVTYTNKAGMSADPVSQATFVIDKTAPTGSISVNGLTWSKIAAAGEFQYDVFVNKPVTAEVTDAKDDLSEIQYIKYYKTDAEEAILGEDLETLYKEGKFSDDSFIFTQDEQFTVYARITDKAGNTLYISTSGVIIDMTKPTVSIKKLQEPNSNGFFHSDVNFRLTVQDPEENKAHSGIKSVRYYVIKDYDESKTAKDQIKSATKTGEVKIDDPLLVDESLVVTADDNTTRNLRVVVVAEDKAGNVIVSASDAVAINSQKPEVTASFDTKGKVTSVDGVDYYKDGRTLVLTYTDEEFTFDQKAAQDGIVITALDAAGKTVAIDKASMISWENKGKTHTATVRFKADANYTVKVSYTNKADVSLVKEPVVTPFTVDTVAPTGKMTVKGKTKDEQSIWEKTWDAIVSFVTFGLYSHDTITVTAEAEDATTTARIEYCKTNTPVVADTEESARAALDKLTFKEYKAPLEFDSSKEKENFIVYLKLTDTVGNYRYIIPDQGFIIDNDPPSVTITPEESKESYNGDVNVIIDVVDQHSAQAYSGIKTISYWVTADGQTTQEKETIDLQTEKPGKYTVNLVVSADSNNSSDVVVHALATDYCGNTSKEAMFGLDIDTTAPVIDVQFTDDRKNEDASDGYFTGRTAEVTITERTVHFNPETATSGIKNKTKALDHNGNVIDGAYEISEWETTEVAGKPDEATHKATVTFNKDAKYTFGVSFSDNTGNAAESFEESFTVDNKAPTLTVEPVEKQDIYNGDVEVKIAASDLFDNLPSSRIKQISYKVIPDDQEATQSVTRAPDSDEDAFTITVDSQLNNSSNVVVYVEAMDNAGNISSAELALDIDVTNPTVSVKFNNEAPYQVIDGRSYFAAERTATVTITERSNHFDPDAAVITVEAKDYKKNDVENTYEIVKNDDGGVKWVTTKGATPDEDTHVAVINFSGDANYTFGVDFTDMAKNPVVEKYNSLFTVDKTDPEGTIIAQAGEEGTKPQSWIENSTEMLFSLWSTISISFTKKASDLTAGVDSVKYYIDYFENGTRLNGEAESKYSDEELTALEKSGRIEWMDYEDFSIKAKEGNRHFVVYLKVTDRSGNFIYLSTDGLIVDDQLPEFESVAPIITLEPRKQPVNGIYNDDVRVDVTVVDPSKDNVYSGLKSVTYKVENLDNVKNNQETQKGKLFEFKGTLTQSSISAARTFKTTNDNFINVDKNKNNSNNVRITVYAVDNAGNKSEKSVDVKIDITKPEMTVSYDNNNVDSGKYFKANRTATIVVKERNFDPNAVKLSISNPHGFIPKLSGWKTVTAGGNGDGTTHTATLVYSEDGDYTFSMNCTDLAGNFNDKVSYNGVVPTEFTVDKTIPVVSVSYNVSGSTKKDSYFSTVVTATITIKEHNFSTDRIKTEITAIDRGSSKAAPSVSGWRNNGDVHTATVTFSNDAHYTFDIDFTDLAGNAAKDYEKDSFYVDRTSPEVIISVPAKPSNGDVRPSVVVKDTNLNKDNISVVLTKMDKQKKVSYSRSAKFNGEYEYDINYDNFTEEQSVDGIYKITATAKDKAGNSKTDSKVFYVNRFGSVYELSGIEDINNNYNQAGKDLVVTESVFGKLTDYSLELVKNDEHFVLEEDADYDLNVIDKGGRSSYTYSIHRDLFEDNGKYTLFFSSKDSAGNSNENIDEGKDAEISFIIDKLPPSIIPTNIESGETYASDGRNVAIEIKDNIALDTVRIYLIKGDKADDTRCTSGNEVKYETVGDLYKFNVPQSTEKQTLMIVAKDRSGRTKFENVEGFLITTNIFARWYNNTPLFIGSIVGVSVLLLGLIIFLLFGRRRKSESEE